MSVRFPNSPQPVSLRTGPIVLIGAIVLGLITTGLMSFWLTSEKKAVAKQVETEPVVISVGTLSPGQKVEPGYLKILQWPKGYLPEGEFFHDTTDVAGRVVQATVLPGQPVYRIQLAGEASNGGLPVIIPKGMRAVTVGISETKGVAGFIKPGDHVDVLVTLPLADDKGDAQITKTVLQDVLVLAMARQMIDPSTDPENQELANKVAQAEVERDMKDPKKGKGKETANAKDEKAAKKGKENRKPEVLSSATLALSPADIEKVTLAEETGAIRLSLRPEQDKSTALLPGYNSRELITGISAPSASSGALSSSDFGGGLAPVGVFPSAQLGKGPARGRAYAPTSVEVIEGTNKTTLNF